MSFTVEKSKTIVSAEEGSYLGTLVTLADLGVQSRGTYKGEKLPDAPLVGMQFELTLDDGSKSLIWKEVLKSGHPQSTLHSYAVALLGGGSKAEAELSGGIKSDSLIGKSVVVTVGLTSGGKPKVVSLTPLRKGEALPEVKAELLVFSASKPDEEVLAKLPKFVQAKLGVKLDKEDSEVDF